MPPKTRRKFTVLDALVLIAAIAIGLAWTRHYQNSEAGAESYPDDLPNSQFVPMDDPLLVRFPGLYRIRVVSWWIVGLVSPRRGGRDGRADPAAADPGRTSVAWPVSPAWSVARRRPWPCWWS